MQTINAKRALIFAIPAAILVVSFLILPKISSLSPSRHELVDVAPYLVSAIGMFLAVHFHRGRPFFVLTILLLFYWSYRTFIGNSTTGLTRQMLIQAFALAIPFNFVIFTIMRERGIFTMAGRLRLIFLGLQAAMIYWLFRHYFVDFEPLITYRFLNLQILDTLAMPQLALALTIICCVSIGFAATVRQAPIDSGFLGTLLAFFIASNWITTQNVTTAYCTAGGLIITLSILQDSYNMAFRDDLTGIPSRRALNESLHGIGRSYAIAMVDIDHFKNFNDTYGHDVGDQVLKLVANKLMGVGGGGKVFRYGGEEFIIVFPRLRTADAIPHLEQLRKTIASYPLAIRSADRPKETRQGKKARGTNRRETTTTVCVSIGVAESGDEMQKAADVVKAADKALYKAKNRGRNQVCQ